MQRQQNDLSHIPVRAVYRITDGNISCIEADYVDIPACTIAAMLAGHFNIPAIAYGQCDNNDDTEK